MQNIKILLMLISALFIISCESNTTQDISLAVTNPTYVANIAPIFNVECTGCHSAAGTNQLPYLDNYNSVKDEIVNGDVLCRIDDQTCGAVMPQSGRMPQATIDMIKLWRNQGFVN